MIDAIVNGLLNFLMATIDLFVSPINDVISGNFPEVLDVVALIGNFITYVSNFFTWILSWINIPHSVFQLGYFTAFACVLVPVLLHTIKLGLAWYRKLMP